jgi:predicted N-acetyltransferase YhbS
MDRLIEIHFSAFPDDRGRGARERNFCENRLGPLSDLRVAEDAAGRVVGHAFLFSLEFHLNRGRVRAAGIASVGVAPEARCAGIATRLAEACHVDAERSGAAFTLLYAFRHAFYTQMGYGQVMPSQLLTLSPGSIPADWRPGRAAMASWRIEGVATVDALSSVYARAAARHSGFLVRSSADWERRVADERSTWLIATCDGLPEAYARCVFSQGHVFGATRADITEWAAVSDEGRRALFGGLRSLRQAETLRIPVGMDDPLAVALTDPDGARWGTDRIEHPLGEIVGGPMIRLASLAGAHEALQLPKDLVLETPDGDRSANPPSAPATRIVASRGVLGAVLFGGVALEAAVALGAATVHPASALTEVAPRVRSSPFLSFDPF